MHGKTCSQSGVGGEHSEILSQSSVGCIVRPYLKAGSGGEIFKIKETLGKL